jgi:uncharacterized membrane protein
MSLVICNQYSFTSGYDVYVATMRVNRDACGANSGFGDGFNAIGWYRIPPGACRTVYTGRVGYNRYWAYYAEATDGATWSGNIQSWVSNSAFSLCHGQKCTPCRVVGFRLLDVNGYDNYTLTLTA